MYEVRNDVYEVSAKTLLGRTFMCASSFVVCARLMTCVHAHRSFPWREQCSLGGNNVPLEGTLLRVFNSCPPT